MTDDASPVLTIVAGPNGAGKSTLTSMGLVEGPVIDPDAIARQINPDNAAAAGREAAVVALRRQRQFLRDNKTFAIETTLSGHGVFRLIEKARSAGYIIDLRFIGQETWQDTRDRVDDRVEKGGHDVSTKDIVRRFSRVFENLPRAIQLADRGFIYDNSQAYRETIAEIRMGQARAIVSELPAWALEAGIIEKKTKAIARRSSFEIKP